MSTRRFAGAPAIADHGASRRLVRWQVVTAAALLVGYAAYYLGRSSLSVALPVLITDPSAGVDRATAGGIASAGILAYTLGKVVTGVAGDFIGGRRLFLGALFASALATLAFSAASGVALLTVLWVSNRFVQSAGWGGLAKMSAHWFPARQYGTVMSVLSLSFLFGDAAGRYGLGVLMTAGVGWRGLFIAAGGTLVLVGLLDLLVLRESPRDLGLSEPEIQPANLFGARGAGSRPESLTALLRPYAMSFSFWLVCLLAFGLTLIREAFNTWIPVYLVDTFQVSPGLAARYSALFPLLGGVSALIAGVLTDRLTPANRVALLVPAMGWCALCLLLLAGATRWHDLRLALWAISGAAFFLLGPYSLLAGAIAMDLGGRHGSSSAVGLVDGAGYLGGAISGVLIGSLVERSGWMAVLIALAAVATAALMVAGIFCLNRRKPIGWAGPTAFHARTT